MKFPVILIILFILYSFGACQSPKTNLQPPVKNDTIYSYQKHSEDGIGKYYLGREVSYVMGAEGAEWLERNNRQQEENTKLAIDKMTLTPQSVVADIGAGTGYYTFAIAGKVPQGKVYAVDVQDEMIRYLNNKKATTAAKNVEVIKAQSNLQIFLQIVLTWL